MPEREEDEGIEELYVVLRGHARFEIDGEAVAAPTGTLIFVEPGANGTAFAEEAGTTVLAVGSRVGQPYEAGGWEVWAEFHPAYEAGDYETVINDARETLEASGYRPSSSTSPVARRWPATRTTRSGTFASPSSGDRASVTSQRRTPTSIPSGTSRRSASCSSDRTRRLARS